jgi:hypothetical protein
VLGHRQNRTEVVGGMAQPAHRQIGVEQIGVVRTSTALKNAA